MEYPFKDLLPLDEVLARDGYYKDWTHLDPEVFYSLTQISNFIKTKGYGVDVRLLIAQLAEHFGLKTTQVVDLANLLSTKHDALKDQFDVIIRDATSGADWGGEIVLARGGKATLGKRLDEGELANYRIKNGKIKIPSDFPKLPFDIFKVSDWNFTHNATPYNQHDWSTATEVFIAGLGATTGLGTSTSAPISLETFHANVTSNLYGVQNDFILSFVNTYYTLYSSINLGALHKNLLLRSASLKGKTYMHPFQLQGSSSITQPWTLDGSIYKSTISGAVDGIPVNVGAGEDEFGISNPHIPVASVSEVRNLVGSYYHDSATRIMYLHPYPSENILDVEIIQKVGNRVFDIANTSNNVLMFENLHFLNGNHRFNPSSVETKLYFFGCNFYRGAQDAFAITGIFTVYLFDCVGAYPNKDTFNYHTTDENSLAVEINGRGYGAGQYKYINEGNQGRASNNGSTAHDGMYMLRVGGEYWDCEGPIIADVGNCYSISIGCRTFDILSTTTTSIMSGLYVETQEGVTFTQEKPKYFIECEQHGKYFTQGVVALRSNKTYVQAVNVDIGEGILIDWEDVV